MMFLTKLTNKLIITLYLGCVVLCPTPTKAEIIGTPPFQTIKIMLTDTGEHYGMVQDNNLNIFVAFMGGIKIFNGAEWQVLEIPTLRSVRSLYYEQGSRVYFGGWDIYGYIEMDEYGVYQYTLIPPIESQVEAKDVWSIITCKEKIYFQGIYTVLAYDPITEITENYEFKEKLGTIVCVDNQLIVQDRSKGFLRLTEQNQWKDAKILLEDNAVIYEMLGDGYGNTFVLSDSKDWRIIKNNKVVNLDISTKLPNLNNYVSVEAVGEGQFVLGSNNGLLTFIDINTLESESFQISNEWISQIVKTQDNGLLVLTEFEIFFLEWPSPIRLQGKSSGLASNMYNIITWNDKTYVASSSGVYVEDKNQLVYQHKLFEKLNWTNKEAWDLLPLNKQQILLAESYKIYLIDQTANETISEITKEIIYPRKLIRSRYDEKIIYVLTEFDVQLLTYTEDMDWTLKEILPFRPLSLIEVGPDDILVGTDIEGLYKVKFHNNTTNEVAYNNISIESGLKKEGSNGLLLYRTLDDEIFAYNESGTYQLVNGKFVNKPLIPRDKSIGNEQIYGIQQGPNGLYFAHTNTHVIYQNKQNKWEYIDLSHYILGAIGSIELIGNQIKVLSHGSISTVAMNFDPQESELEYKLNITSIKYKNNYREEDLPLSSRQPYRFEEDTGSITFTYIYNDIRHQDNIRYRYSLTGQHESWMDYVENNNQVTFNQLSAGDYQFQVQARDENNKLYTSKKYNFIVYPHWYLTVPAKTIWTIVFLIVIWNLFQRIIKWRERLHEVQKAELKKVISSKTAELNKLNKNLQKMAHTDGLTGLYNRIYLDEFITKLVKNPVESIIVIMLDMDKFKIFNDKFGHVAGDTLLIQLADSLNSQFNRPSDIVARFGGEEFIAILINTDLDYALKSAEAIRKTIECKKKSTGVSIGICECSDIQEIENADDVYHLIDCADKALYRAKRTGRNKVSVWQPNLTKEVTIIK